MLEYKTEKCDPEDLDAICQALQVWGWKLEQTQEVYNENTEILSNETHLVGREDIFGNYHDVHWESKPVTQKTVTHYISARFSRNKDMPNYKKICDLEEEYYHPKEESPKVAIKAPSSNVGKALGIMFTVLFVGAFALAGAISSSSIIFLLCAIIPLAAIVVVCIVCAVKANKTYKIAYAKFTKDKEENDKLVAEYETRIDRRRTEILEEVLTLLPDSKNS